MVAHYTKSRATNVMIKYTIITQKQMGTEHVGTWSVSPAEGFIFLVVFLGILYSLTWSVIRNSELCLYSTIYMPLLIDGRHTCM